jgi:hypothetical protein
LIVGHAADGNVPVGDHADELAVGGDRNGADIELAHSVSGDTHSTPLCIMSFTFIGNSFGRAN